MRPINNEPKKTTMPNRPFEVGNPLAAVEIRHPPPPPPPGVVAAPGAAGTPGGSVAGPPGGV